jgi:hypothetical protein
LAKAHRPEAAVIVVVQVGPADATDSHIDADFACGWCGQGGLFFDP